MIGSSPTKKTATRLSSGPSDASAARFSVESELYRNSWMTRVVGTGGDKEIRALAENRGWLRWDEHVVCVWRPEMSQRVLVVEEIFSLEIFSF